MGKKKLLDRIVEWIFAKTVVYQAKRNLGWVGTGGIFMNDETYVDVLVQIKHIEQDAPTWSKTIDQRIADGEIDPEYFFEGGGK